MRIQLSNGLLHFYQWDKGQKVKAPDGVETIHFRVDYDHAVPITVVSGWATVPDECFQSGDDLVYYAYDEDHTTDTAKVEVLRRPKPDDYAYTPTEVKTWESLDERIKALENGGGVAGVSSVNGQTGAVTITAEGLGALTEDSLQTATDAALKQAKESGEFDGAQGPAGAALDITGASVGQTVKISAVDDSGVPTAWVPVDMVSGSDSNAKFRLIRSITLEEQTDRIDVTADDDGNPFEVTEVYVGVNAQSYEDAYQQVVFLPNGGWATRDAFIISTNNASKSTETWKSAMIFHAVYADGVIFSQQLPVRSNNGQLASAYAAGQNIITKVSLSCKFAAGCEIVIIGR